MHLVGFIIRIYDDARSHERQIHKSEVSATVCRLLTVPSHLCKDLTYIGPCIIVIVEE